MSHRAPADVGLSHFLHFNGGLHAGGNSGSLQSVLQGDGIHHGGEHADVVSCGAIHAGGGALQTSKNVSAADDNRQLRASSNHFGNICGDGRNNFWINSVALIAHQRFTADLQEGTRVGHSTSLSVGQ